jgi:hypothetical protein
VNAIKSLNQVWMNSIKLYPNSKSRTEFRFSFDLYWPLVKMSNTKVVPNTLIYLQENFHNFLMSPSIFPQILSTSMLNRKSFWEKEKLIFLHELDPSANPARSTKTNRYTLCRPTSQPTPLCAGPPVRGNFPKSRRPRTTGNLIAVAPCPVARQLP